jgi:hypothetical protein
MIKTFSPNSAADTAQLSAGTTSARVALDVNSAVVRVLNAGPSLAYLQFGDGSVTSTNAKMPIPVGATELFTKGTLSHAAAIVDSGSAVLYFTPGEGI